ncbi:hypothetical protein CROQUDRAFT_673802 [Cronartium quercuum f. sp. fusiforme G11]|uniref:Retrovirus-related Pol polyprotein from transposon TNT 1-94-like beta-barrel domain-containing protein n=1 Tax=Cronartium quercuum f. sp. fusiforme G11 TaxID=708437 RepID=A0A9P6NDH1_9BASI|nr:hypothetical protein CROQUDRAFT_673802 [Cronartium quercuum f. sp. fusiforme G11]
MLACDCQTKIDHIFLAEIVVSKFPDELEIAKEILAEKRPLTLSIVLDCLDKHKHRTSKIIYCSNGIHNANAKHSKEECYQLHPEKRPIRIKKRYDPKTPTASASSAILPAANCECTHSKALSCSAIEETASTLLDSACSDHMTPDCNAFTDFREERSHVTLADNSIMEIMGRGTMIGSSQDSIITFDTYHVPEISSTLISLGTLLLEGCKLESDGSNCTCVY